MAAFSLVVKMLDFHVGNLSSNPGCYTNIMKIFSQYFYMCGVTIYLWSGVKYIDPQFKYDYFGGSRHENVENHWIRHSNDIQEALVPCKSASSEQT